MCAIGMIIIIIGESEAKVRERDMGQRGIFAAAVRGPGNKKILKSPPILTVDSKYTGA